MNHATNPDLTGFATLLETISPWLSQVVIVGWAHRLFRSHPLAQRVAYEALVTVDADIAVPANLEVKEQDLLERLHSAGFQEELFGDLQPPATHYRLSDERGSFYVEFLAPLVGSEYDRDGNRRATSEVAGVTSQNLRYVDLLLEGPWIVALSRANGFPLSDSIQARIANPTHFMAQKLLIHDKRERRSRVKDILYLHDTIELFGAALDMLNREWVSKAKPLLSEKAIQSVEGAADDLFADVSDDIRGAARAAVGRAVSAEAIQELCRAGLSHVFKSG